MEESECARCGRREVIATHQQFKLEGEVKYLCRRCWEDFRHWFNRPEKRDEKEKK